MERERVIGHDGRKRGSKRSQGPTKSWGWKNSWGSKGHEGRKSNEGRKNMTEREREVLNSQSSIMQKDDRKKWHNVLFLVIYRDFLCKSKNLKKVLVLFCDTLTWIFGSLILSVNHLCRGDQIEYWNQGNQVDVCFRSCSPQQII